MAELEQRFGEQIHCTLHKGDRGVFDVLADGQPVFRKHSVGRFPIVGEVADAIAERLP